MSTPPAKRKNMAVTADGAQYNKRQRPDNYAALPAPAPPSRHPNPPKAAQDEPTPTPTPTSTIKTETSEVKVEPVAKVKSEDTKDEGARNDGMGNKKSDDKASEPEAPGSPVDAPETHFATFTPMGQGKVLYKKPKGEQNNDESKGKNKKRANQKDLRYGQASALELNDSASDNGEGVEAMRYLKGVRLEANGLPITFRGTEPSDSRAIYNTAVGDMRGFYDDGAYVARPRLIGPVMPPGFAASEAFDEEEEEEYEDEDQYMDDEEFVEWVDVQQEYHNRLLLRFEGYRNLMAQTPTEGQQESLDRSRYCTFPRSPPKVMRQAVRRWLSVFTDMPPHPVQVAQMDSYCVLKLLDILKRKLECFKDVEENISLWIFALLARLCEVIPIYCDEASIVREMALRALMVRVTFTGEHIAELEDKVPQYYTEDQDFFEHVDADPRQVKKQKEGDEYGDAALRKALEEKKELLMKKEELKKRVEEMPRMLSKREAFGLSPRDASSDEDEEEEKKPGLKQDTAESQEPAFKKEDSVSDQQEETEKPNANANTRTTLNMILAVACDVFGQKDLSKYLEIWGEYDYPEPLAEQMEVLEQSE